MLHSQAYFIFTDNLFTQNWPFCHLVILTVLKGKSPIQNTSFLALLAQVLIYRTVIHSFQILPKCPYRQVLSSPKLADHGSLNFKYFFILQAPSIIIIIATLNDSFWNNHPRLLFSLNLTIEIDKRPDNFEKKGIQFSCTQTSSFIQYFHKNTKEENRFIPPVPIFQAKSSKSRSYQLKGRQSCKKIPNYQKTTLGLQVLPFHLSLIIFTMSNLRKRTLPDHVFGTTLSHHSIAKPSQLRSQMRDLQMPESYFQETQKLIKPQIQSQETLYQRSSKKVKSFQFDELDKILYQNRLTLGFDDHAKNTDFPQISTFKKTQKLLVSPPIFEQFKEANKQNGYFRSALSQAEHEFNAKKMRIKVSKDSQIIVRQNCLQACRGLTQSSSENDTNSILSKSRKNGFSMSVGAAQKMRKNIRSLRKLSYAIGIKGLEKLDKWKLKDFYDPILQQLQENEMNVKRLRERESILFKLKRIDAQCTEMENNTQAAQSIQVFAKYSKNMSDKLVKKQRKIDKVYFYAY